MRAAQRSKILDGHRSGGYARQRALSTSRNSLPRGAPFYNAWDENVAPKFFRGIASGREDGQTDTKNAEPVLLAPHEVSR